MLCSTLQIINFWSERLKTMSISGDKLIQTIQKYYEATLDGELVDKHTNECIYTRVYESK